MTEDDKPGEQKTERFNMFMSPSESQAIDDWMWANRIRSKSEAVRRLVQIALRFEASAKRIDIAGRRLSSAYEEMVQTYRHQSSEEAGSPLDAIDVLTSTRKIIERTRDIIDAVANPDLQRVDLTDATKTIEEAIAAADETLELFGGEMFGKTKR